MQYLLSVYHEDRSNIAPPENMQQIFEDVDKVNAEMQAEGAWIFAGGLYPPSDATVLRVQDNGEVITTDGPYAETKEALGGFWVIEAADLDAAMEWARKGAVACREVIEIRPFQPEPPQA